MYVESLSGTVVGTIEDRRDSVTIKHLIIFILVDFVSPSIGGVVLAKGQLEQ